MHVRALRLLTLLEKREKDQIGGRTSFAVVACVAYLGRCISAAENERTWPMLLLLLLSSCSDETRFCPCPSSSRCAAAHVQWIRWFGLI